ncbi:hypothetical protein [Yoonia maritima]|uniref:hypothetical protein n=1 Tax=Yoonia maritima TaxID=1435347 RepID=UPI0037357766
MAESVKTGKNTLFYAENGGNSTHSPANHVRFTFFKARNPRQPKNKPQPVGTLACSQIKAALRLMHNSLQL